MSKIEIPIVTLGPGSQPGEEDGAELAYLPLPSEMDNYIRPVLPEPEEVAGLDQAMVILESMLTALQEQKLAEESCCLDLTDLDDANRDLVDQVLGEGEVSMVFTGETPVRVQEAVLAGLWRVRHYDVDGRLAMDRVEIGAVPRLVRAWTFAKARESVAQEAGRFPEGVLNAPPLLVELDEHIARHVPGGPPHVINLTLLPQTPEDLQYLGDCLGAGPLSILSRGYGNCRITSTATRNVWWVQYFNSQDVLILNTLEVTDVPAAASASSEDLEDSAQRLEEILEVYR